MRTEQQIKLLEDKIKALKATYAISGGLVNFVMQTSQVFQVDVSAGSSDEYVSKTIQFTPIYGANRNNLIDLRATATLNGHPFFPMYVNNPQSGDGRVSITIKIPKFSNAATYYITVIAAGTSTGYFSML